MILNLISVDLLQSFLWLYSDYIDEETLNYLKIFENKSKFKKFTLKITKKNKNYLFRRNVKFIKNLYVEEYIDKSLFYFHNFFLKIGEDHEFYILIN